METFYEVGGVTKTTEETTLRVGTTSNFADRIPKEEEGVPEKRREGCWDERECRNLSRRPEHLESLLRVYPCLLTGRTFVSEDWTPVPNRTGDTDCSVMTVPTLNDHFPLQGRGRPSRVLTT